ncbi:MAG: hypothetical protein WA137_06115 [Methanothrix sp.]|jgi:flagellar biosynthesis component FlhA|nr:hypothetical protein [Methanothrix sp.]
MDLAVPLRKDAGIDPNLIPFKDQLPVFLFYDQFEQIIWISVAALVSVLVLCIVDMLMDVLFTIVSVCVFVLIIIMATHLDSPPFYY